MEISIIRCKLYFYYCCRHYIIYNIPLINNIYNNIIESIIFFILRDTREAGISKYSGLLPKLSPDYHNADEVKGLKILLDMIMKQSFHRKIIS